MSKHKESIEKTKNLIAKQRLDFVALASPVRQDSATSFSGRLRFSLHAERYYEDQIWHLKWYVDGKAHYQSSGSTRREVAEQLLREK